LGCAWVRETEESHEHGADFMGIAGDIKRTAQPTWYT